MQAIVVGAGPGGAMAALALARAGATVHLVEKSAWPRDKTCGDGVSPLAIREAAEVGASFAHGRELRRALIVTPGGIRFRGGWPTATPYGTIVERTAFDAALVEAAIAAGVDFRPATAVRTIAADVAGLTATLECGNRQSSLRTDVAIVAEGATGSLAGQLGFPAFRSRLVAIRGYATAPSVLTAEYGLFYDRSLSPGYGWIFPVDERRANVGICVDEATLSRNGGDLRAALASWLADNAFVREAFGPTPKLERVRGGIIPSGRARRVSGRVFLVGDAAGVADPFTAEGIFEAMHSARIAAEALAREATIDAAGVRYERDVRMFDRNALAARTLRATFGIAIEPYARHAARHPAFADRLATGVFFPKGSFSRFLFDVHRGP